MISMATKLEIINKYEGGARIVSIAKEYGRNQSTIATIIKNKQSIKANKASKGMTILASNRCSIHNEMERLLLLWIKEKEIRGDSITQSAISHKATALFDDLLEAQRDSGGEGTSHQTVSEFKASNGWFERFKRRTGIHSVIRHGEAASSDKKEANNFLKKFEELISNEGYIPQQVFNCDETGLFWKKLPCRTYITAEEKKLPGHKPMKDRLTLALCANASGDLKIKPLLVYHSENPRAFKAHKITKDRLAVFWKSNSKAWVTRAIFIEWINVCFGPAVREYLDTNNLPLKCLLVLDNAPAHPPGLEENLHSDFSFIKVCYLPPNTTPLLQPMDQQVIANFKKLYTKQLFRRCFEVTESTQLTLREFWKVHFDIVQGLKIVEKAWNEVSKQTLKSSWKMLWPGVEANQDAEDSQEEIILDPTSEGDVTEIVSLGMAMGLVVDEADIDNLIEEHREELTTEDLKELEAMQGIIVQEEQQFGGDEDLEGTEKTTSTEIKEALSWYENLTRFIANKHPEKVLTSRAMDNVNDTCLSYFRDILKNRQKQTRLDKFFKRKVSKGTDDDSECNKRARKESAPEEVLSD